MRKPAPPPAASTEAKLLTVAEVATALSVCERTIRRWVDTGDLKAYRLNRVVRISVSDLQSFLERRR
jgi:excisionase family DNA binding protein